MQHLPGFRPILVLLVSLLSGIAACQQPPPAKTAPAPVEPRGATDPEAVAAARLTGGEGRAARWKDTAVYLDGKPIGMLAFGELPIGLDPVWVEDELSVTVKPGQRGPAFRRVKQRQYRFIDYLRALGVDTAAIWELHVYGPKPSEVLVVSGAELGKRGAGLGFRFGAEVAGKAIPVVPDDVGNGLSPDKIAAVAVYIERTPPTVVRNVGLFLAGAPVAGIPYAEQPVRGGVHVYLDDRLATVIKRKRLPGARVPAAGMEQPSSQRLLELLAAHGVDTQRVLELWIIRDERRAERLTRAQLASATFELGTSARAVVHLDGAELAVGALALHSRALRPDQLPRILPDEDEASHLATP